MERGDGIDAACGQLRRREGGGSVQGNGLLRDDV
jgi:hypothetical protein